ncbi:hypothetical protein HHI36_003161 [Cryptolaemus montrouzieri]|uniref:Uncharacterized protein n=1 Tax=Cryptolaemus montrouzieri TaxID=559131 RepID=A0ABD2PDK7_9CUCU
MEVLLPPIRLHETAISLPKAKVMDLDAFDGSFDYGLEDENFYEPIKTQKRRVTFNPKTFIKDAVIFFVARDFNTLRFYRNE